MTPHFLVCGSTPCLLSSLDGPRASCRHGQESYSTPRATAHRGVLISNPTLQDVFVHGDVAVTLPKQGVALVQQEIQRKRSSTGVVESQPCNTVAYSHPYMCDRNQTLSQRTALAESHRTTWHLWHPLEGDVNLDSESDTASLH